MRFNFPTWEEAVKHDMYCFAKQVEKNKPKTLLIDARSLAHQVSPKLQAWALEVVERPAIKAGVQKIAFVKPHDDGHWSNIAVEDQDHKRYFDNIEDAQAWLNNSGY